MADLREKLARGVQQKVPPVAWRVAEGASGVWSLVMAALVVLSIFTSKAPVELIRSAVGSEYQAIPGVIGIEAGDGGPLALDERVPVDISYTSDDVGGGPTLLRLTAERSVASPDEFTLRSTLEGPDGLVAADETTVAVADSNLTVEWRAQDATASARDGRNVELQRPEVQALLLSGLPIIGPIPRSGTLHLSATATGDPVLAVRTYTRPWKADDADGRWSSSDSRAGPGQTFEVLIELENSGDVRLDDVVVGSNLPRYTSYVAGSARLRNGNYPDGVPIDNDNVTRGGINVGSYEPDSRAYVTFRAEIDESNAFQKLGTYQLAITGLAKSDEVPATYNAALLAVEVGGSGDVPWPWVLLGVVLPGAFAVVFHQMYRRSQRR